MNRYPWRNTSEDIAEQTPSQWETPAGAQAKADAAEAAAKEYSDERLAEHVGTGGDAHALAVPDGAAGFISGADQAKLNGIEEHAEVNQNAFAQVNNVAAASESDTLTIVGGTGITISTNPTMKTVTVTATGEATPGPHGSSHDPDGSDPIPALVALRNEFDALTPESIGAETPEGAQAKVDALAGVGNTKTVAEVAEDVAGVTAQLAETEAEVATLSADYSQFKNSTNSEMGKRKLITYAELSDIGLSSSDFELLTTQEQYAEKIILAMADNSILQLSIISNNNPIPNGDNFLPVTIGTASKDGLLVVRKASNDRTEFEYTFNTSGVAAIGGAYNDKHHAVFVNGLSGQLRRWSGWKRFVFDGAENNTWQDAVLQNSWVTYAGRKPQYIKDALGKVTIRGAATGGVTTQNSLIFTLPAGYRPPAITKVSTICWTGSGNPVLAVLTIGTDGVVIIDYVPGNNWLSFDGISFYT